MNTHLGEVTFGGLEVLVSDALPMHPGDRENMRRFVRHQFGAEYLEWMGQDVGPKPGDPIHVMVDYRDRVIVSAEMHEKLLARIEADVA